MNESKATRGGIPPREPGEPQHPQLVRREKNRRKRPTRRTFPQVSGYVGTPVGTTGGWGVLPRHKTDPTPIR